MQENREFTNFNFSLPSDRQDLIDMANFLVQKANEAQNTNFENLKNEILSDIFDNPKNRAVFERLKDK